MVEIGAQSLELLAKTEPKSLHATPETIEKLENLAVNIIGIMKDSGYQEALDYRHEKYQIRSNTALTLSIKTGAFKVAEKLIEAGADAAIKSIIGGFTPLHLACQLYGTKPGKQEGLEKLIKSLSTGANLTIKDHYGFTPTDYLDFKFNIDLDRQAQNAITGEVKIRIGSDSTNNRELTFQDLTEQKFNKNILNNIAKFAIDESFTFFQNMVELTNNKATVQAVDLKSELEVIKNTHSVSLSDNNNDSIIVKREYKSAEKTTINSKKYTGKVNIFKAIMHEDMNTVKTLLSMGIDPNAKDEQGNSLLHLAGAKYAQSKSKSAILVIGELLKFPVDVKSVNADGVTFGNLFVIDSLDCASPKVHKFFASLNQLYHVKDNFPITESEYRGDQAHYDAGLFENINSCQAWANNERQFHSAQITFVRDVEGFYNNNTSYNSITEVVNHEIQMMGKCCFEDWLNS